MNYFNELTVKRVKISKTVYKMLAEKQTVNLAIWVAQK